MINAKSLVDTTKATFGVARLAMLFVAFVKLYKLLIPRTLLGILEPGERELVHIPSKKPLPKASPKQGTLF